MKRVFIPLLAACLLITLGFGLARPNRVFWNSLEVTVTAYNSTRAQTDGSPLRAAWNNRLKPGMKAIAVSRDLLHLGLTDQTEVWIDGIDGYDGYDGPYLVLDKMNRRFKRRIDVYFGLDVQAAREFGERQARIYWR